MNLAEKVGMEFGPFTFEIEKGKIKEFATAIGDPNPLYLTGDALPPTFGTVIELWGGLDFFELIKSLGLNIEKVLHGEQEYEYLEKIKPGEKLTCVTRVAEIKRKARMVLIKLETHYKNEEGKLVLISRNTILERN